MLKIIEDSNGREADIGIRVRVASASYGRPVCIEPFDRRDESLGLTVYTHDGAIVGVRVTEGLNDEVGKPVVEYGLVPNDATETCHDVSYESLTNR